MISKSLWTKLVLVGVFIIAVAQLLMFAMRVINESLQVDFSAYYAAGEALNYGLSPYNNNILHNPPIWDGFTRESFSRFLYPPITAAIFQPFALISYSAAKAIWLFISILSLVIALIIAVAALGIETVEHRLLIGIASTLFLPLFACLERGQIDLVTLVVLSVFVALLMKGRSRNDAAAGFVLAFACLLKPYSLYLLPFLLIRKKWWALTGFVFGAAFFVLLNLIMPSGKTYLLEYARKQAPVIARLPFDGSNVSEYIPERVFKQKAQSLLENVPDGFTVMDGEVYQLGILTFSFRATLVRPLELLLGYKVSPLLISLGLFSLFFLVFWLWFISSKLHLEARSRTEYIFWAAAFMIILLTAPLTWTMNVVWVIPISVVLAGEIAKLRNVSHIGPFLALATGYLLAAMPDAGYSLLVGGSNLLYKYILAELLILSGCMSLIVVWSKEQRNHYRQLNIA